MNSLTIAQANASAHAAVAALRRGDGREARRLIEGIVAAGLPIQPPWLLLADACRMCGDRAAEEQAVDALLAAEPRNVAGLLVKGDARAAAGDEPGANSHYQLAIAVAQDREVPHALLPHLRRAEQVLGASRRRYEDFLRASLAAGDAGPEAIGARFAEAIDILTGRRQPYLQQPTIFYLPGLPNRQFFERAEFGWAAALEGRTPLIQAELAATEADFVPYLEQVAHRPPNPNPLLNDPRWSSLHLWKNGTAMPANQARFPATLAALRDVPLPDIPGREPIVMFSRLQPKTHIVAHNGAYNTRLICHLPLVVPDGCRFRVGNEVRPWRLGELTIFDDSIEHEAWNDGASERTVLLFDIWRPDLTPEERHGLTVLFRTIQAYHGD